MMSLCSVHTCVCVKFSKQKGKKREREREREKGRKEREHLPTQHTYNSRTSTPSVFFADHVTQFESLNSIWSHVIVREYARRSTYAVIYARRRNCRQSRDFARRETYVIIFRARLSIVINRPVRPILFCSVRRRTRKAQ